MCYNVEYVRNINIELCNLQVQVINMEISLGISININIYMIAKGYIQTIGMTVCIRGRRPWVLGIYLLTLKSDGYSINPPSSCEDQIK